MLAGSPAALQLRYLQTLSDIGKGEGSTVLLVVRAAGHDGTGIAQLDRAS